MRVDAKALLDRLGKSDFSYKEFADRFSELELWPLFEALLKDERMSQLDDTPEAGEDAASVSMPVEAGAKTAESLSSIFNRYESGGTAAAAAAPSSSDAAQQDVRALLRQLSELSRKGDL